MSATQPTAHDELNRLNQWVGWRREYVKDRGEWTKVPYSPVTAHKASSTDRSTWASRETAERYRDVAGLDGVGFVFAPGGDLTGIDLDHCREANTGEIAPWAMEIIAAMDSYTELSPSATGVHIFVHGALPTGRRKLTRPDGSVIEMYDQGRYFTFTGQHLDGAPAVINARQRELADLHAWVFPPHPEPSRHVVMALHGASTLSNDDVLRIARRAKNGGRFTALYDQGDLSMNNGDDSAADLALCDLLAFYCGPTGHAQVDALFQGSALMRPKWDEQHGSRTYGEMTIDKAYADRTEFYTVSTNGLHADLPDPTPIWQPSTLLAAEEASQAARDTFVDRYVAYAAQRTDAPRQFHEALGLSALSVAVGRRAVLKLTNGTVYPSLWILILADSTLYRKSTAMDLTRDLLERLDRTRLAPNDFTPQRFVALLAENDGHPLLYMRDEFSGFYDALNRLDFMAGLKELLCNVYDGRPFRREKMKPKQAEGKQAKDDEWKYDVRDPFLSLSVATTEERFTEVARVNDVHSGFLPRFAFVLPPTESPKRRPVRELDPALEATRDDLAHQLRSIVQTDIHLTCEQAVFARFDQYVADLEAEAISAPDGNLVGIVGARGSWMAMRIAILLAVADRSQRVSLAHLLRGIEIAEPWRHNALKTLAALAPSKFEKRATRLIQVIERAETAGISRRDAMRAIRASSREMDELENTLRERGELRIDTAKLPGGASKRYFAPGVTAVTGDAV